MRVAVFTNKFPGHTSSFFARDMRALIAAGVEVDIFPFYPLDPTLWRFVPALLDESVLSRDRVHHIDLRAALRAPPRAVVRRLLPATREALALGAASLRYGVEMPMQVGYVGLKAWAWSLEQHGPFDHILAYWGNHAATCAALFHRLTDPTVPFSMIVHARMDLYRRPAGLARKMLYADNVFIVCEFNRRYLAAHYPAVFARLAPKLRLHHIGLDLRSLAFTPEPRPPATVIAVGRLEPLKGFVQLLHAIQLVRRRGVPVVLEVVGGGEQEAELRALAARLELASHVVFRGWIAPDEVPEAIRGATVLAHASVELDAMPTVLKEAIAVGTPVIASDLAGAPEIVDQGRAGILVPPGDVLALADAIVALINSPAKRRALAGAGRRHAEATFDLWTNGRRLADALRATPRRTPEA
jgi:glycosyltransferase involved in cell wall biosynthesis